MTAREVTLQKQPEGCFTSPGQKIFKNLSMAMLSVNIDFIFIFIKQLLH